MPSKNRPKKTSHKNQPAPTLQTGSPLVPLREYIGQAIREELNQMHLNRTTPPQAEPSLRPRGEDAVIGGGQTGAACPTSVNPSQAPKCDMEVVTLLNQIRDAHEVTEKALSIHHERLSVVRRQLPAGPSDNSAQAPEPIKSPLGAALSDVLRHAQRIQAMASHLGDELAI